MSGSPPTQHQCVRIATVVVYFPGLVYEQLDWDMMDHGKKSSLNPGAIEKIIDIRDTLSLVAWWISSIKAN